MNFSTSIICFFIVQLSSMSNVYPTCEASLVRNAAVTRGTKTINNFFLITFRKGNGITASKIPLFADRLWNNKREKKYFQIKNILKQDWVALMFHNRLSNGKVPQTSRATLISVFQTSLFHLGGGGGGGGYFLGEVSPFSSFLGGY